MYSISKSSSMSPWLNATFMVCPIVEHHPQSGTYPHTSININKLEAIQRSAARISYKEYSKHSTVSTMLPDLACSTLPAEQKN